MNSAYLQSRARLVINKKQNYFSLPDHHLSENLILVFGFYEKAKNGKIKIVAKFVRSPKFLVNSLLHIVLLLIT